MLLLKNVTKSYVSGDLAINALDGVDLAFRKNEFVSILGPSGSGKTTLLNIIGGLDQYTKGDLIINGKSTKKFRDSDWDTYRNHSVGFVFQSYNLIPHQSVLSNVELALTLSGVPKRVRREKAREALIKVGLGDQLHKKPNQMSGGQMQRVAIARALVNDPDILLADEPTGALDSVTSVQIMELLKEVSQDRLVIMVTHNPELADQYSSRIVSLKDGKIVNDTNPVTAEEEEDLSKKVKKPSMSLFTALSLSLNNLLTKKARTFLTSFAGSIGIIGIALILSLSSGVSAYINQVQEDTLSSYPIIIESEQVDMSSMISSIVSSQDKSHEHPKDKVYASSVMYDLVNSMNNSTVISNDLKKLKEHFESGSTDINEHVRTIQYLYSVPMNVYAKNKDNKYQKSDIMEVFSSIMGQSMNTGGIMGQLSQGFTSFDTWAEILPAMDGAPVSDVFSSQFEVLYGQWPTKKDQLVLVLDRNNEVTDITLHALGLATTEKMIADTLAAQKGEEVVQENISFTYEEICAIPLRIIPSASYYTFNEAEGIWEDISDNKDSMDVIINNGLELHVTCIVRPTEDASISTSDASLYYTNALTRYLIEETNKYDVVKAQLDKKNENLDIFTGLPFVSTDNTVPTTESRVKEMKDYFASLTVDKKAEMFLTLTSVPDMAFINSTVEKYLEAYPDRASLEAMIYEQYASSAGLDEESIRAFIEGYTDEELRETVEESIRAMLIEQHKQSAKDQAELIARTPSAEELTPFIAQITSKLTDRNAKTMYIVSEYTRSTAMDAQTVMAYLARLTDAQIDEIVNSLASETAKTLYAQYATSDPVQSAKKLAAAFDAYYPTLTDEKLVEAYDECMPPKTSDSTLKDNLKMLGVQDISSPTSIGIYVSTFADKDAVAEIISTYNASADEDSKITYTDIVGIIMSSVTTIINAITYVLIAFVSISLVVSSIMIGIITYISVLERTKEIGILRAIGASKRDVSRVFTAETFIIGFISGSIGIIVTLLLLIPANAIIRALSGIETLTAYLPLAGGLLLMAVSIILTLIAGLFPSRIAAKKDPVEALRSE